MHGAPALVKGYGRLESDPGVYSPSDQYSSTPGLYLSMLALPVLLIDEPGHTDKPWVGLVPVHPSFPPPPIVQVLDGRALVQTHSLPWLRLPRGCRLLPRLLI